VNYFSVLLLLAGTGAAADLSGVVDVHVHSAPDVIARSLDAIDAARQAHAAGLRAIMLKNHYEPTASWAYFVTKAVPGLEVFGCIALNRAVGGVNPAAVRRMASLPGGRGKVVWMPTFDAENHVRKSGENRLFVPVSRAGRLLPEVLEVLDVIHEHGLVLATGHSTPAETRMMIAEARKRGINAILVTHAMVSTIRMTVAQMKEAADAGALIEFAYNGLIGAQPEATVEQYVAAARAIGPDRCVLSSDLGQANNPLPVDGMRAYIDLLVKRGFGAREIRRMTVENPASLLGLR
jgi:hypothetical protein